MRAIVIEDSRAARAILGQMLREGGFEVVEAADGRAALERLRAEAAAAGAGGGVSLALVDWNMPGMSGIDFVRAVRSDPALAGLRLLMVTAQTERESVAEALDAGADEYLMKPFRRDMLESKLALMGVLA
jgi:two-component system chemotaxis response regulator CheY